MDEFNTQTPENKGIFPACFSLFAQHFATCLFPHLPPALLGFLLIGSASLLTRGLELGFNEYVLIFLWTLTRGSEDTPSRQTGALLDGESWGCARIAWGWRKVRCFLVQKGRGGGDKIRKAGSRKTRKKGSWRGEKLKYALPLLWPGSS